MLLGLHTYSLHLHGMGQNWGGFKLQWEPVWDVFGLMDEAKKLGLDGLHLTAADLGSTDRGHLRDVRRAAEERGLYLEYNFSLDASGYDDRLTHTMEEGIAIAESIGSDIGKISMDIHRPHPVCGSAFHPEVVPQLEDVARKAEAAAPVAQNAGVRLCLENHTEAFSDEVLWIINRVNHPYVGVCVDTNNLSVSWPPYPSPIIFPIIALCLISTAAASPGLRPEQEMFPCGKPIRSSRQTPI
jgi:sugar phosphate isomerase/epimerase